MSVLLLRLAAPLQSWGIDSKFEVRRTGREPSKSGIIGLLAAALGIPRDGDISKLTELKTGVRVEREGHIIRDFHTARAEKTSYITNRYYLSDAVFLAGIEGDDDFIEEIAQALKNPVYPLFLGRRSCPPTLPLLYGIRNGELDEVLRAEPYIAGANPDIGTEYIRFIIDSDDEDAVLQRDLPISFSQNRRKYGFRGVKSYSLKRDERTEDTEIRIEHDAMAELEENEYVSEQIGAESE